MSAGALQVLLVDDDPDFAVLVRRALSKAAPGEASLRTCPGGAEAMAYLAEAPTVPDLLLLDLKMPRVSGFEVLEWLRRSPIGASLPAVVLTSSDHEVDRERARSLGAASYELKPAGFHELVALLRKLVAPLRTS